MQKVNAILVHSADNCVTLSSSACAGGTVTFLDDGAAKAVTAREEVPIWHKMAVLEIKKGEDIYKYGAVIGKAAEDIDAGDHVHVHNMRSPGSVGLE